MKKIVFIAFMLLMAVAMQGQVTFTAAEWANAQSLSNGAAVTGYSQDGVTVEFAQGTGSNAVVWNTSQNAIVTRQGNTMTVSVAEGQVITSASFTMKQNSHANALSGSTWSEGSASANNTVATWTGSAQTITVTIGGTALFDSFTITAEVPEAPFVEDESTYNDTTIITPQEIADENFMGAGDEFESLSYSKEGKQLTLSKGDVYYTLKFTSSYQWEGLALTVYTGHSIQITAPYRIKKIILRDAQGQNDYVWIGSSTQVKITDAYLNILDITIISDATDSSPYTVNFYGLNGALLKTEQVPVGGSATAPVVSHECFDGWDKDFSVVHSNMDVHAQLVISSEWELSEWRWNANSSLTYTQNGYTFTMAYADRRTQPYWYWDNLYLTPGDRLTITRENTFYGMKFIAGDETAAALAAAQCNTGTLRRDGNDVYWFGATNALTLTISANSDNIKLGKIGFACDYYEQVPCVVVFLDANGQEIARETVMAGEGLTNIPAGPAHEDECMEFAGWDVTDFSRIMHDMTVHPLYRAKAIISLTATEWAESQGGSLSRITKDGFTLYGSISYNSNDSSIVVRRNGGFIILNPYYFYHLTFSCSTEAYATALASNKWSSGSVVQDGTDVIWTGDTDSLSFIGSATHIVSITSLCQHFEVVFLGENDQPISTQSLTSGNAAIAPPAPVHSNECMQFAGWDHEFTRVYGNLTIRPIWNLLDDCTPEGYVKVLFLDLTGDTLDTQFVLIGGSVTAAPDAPALKYHTFTGWDHALTNLTENTIIRPVYTYDTNSPDILTVVDYNNLKDTAQWRLEEDPIRAIKGLYHAKERETVEDGKLTFELQWYDGNWLKSTTVYDMLSLNGEPFISHLDITEGDTVIVFGTYVNEWVEYWGGEWHREGLKDGYVVWIGAKRAEEGYTNINMPDAATLYDFSGNGLKQAVYTKDNMTILTKDITNDFHPEQMLGTAGSWPIFIEDVNHDGHPDVSHWYFNSLLSSGANYELADGALFLPNFDANSDGRIDYMLPSSNDIMYQMADGSFRKEHMQIYSYDEFMAQFDETEWISTYSENVSTYSSGSSGLVANTGWSSGMNLSGACLARTPRRQDVHKAPSIGYTVSAVTRALDLNADGFIDLVDEKNGFLYQNMGNSKWIQFNIGRIVQPADLNNDGFTDYIFPGTQLYVMIYQGNGQFDYRNIYSNAAVDDLLYCYDFDHDGDIDILATFSTKHNATNRAYTCFFLNDGQGNFARQTEQIYGTENLWFSACQDINGDGYMDLLAFRGDINNTWRAEFAANTDIEIVWLQGNANKTFSNPQMLYTIASTEEGLSPEVLRINAEDLDNDGKAEIWVSGMNLGKTRLFTIADATVNAAPTAPAAPTLLYDNGYLTVSWGNGADAQTQTGDLTYALRIGTTAGGNEILAAHANADGTRRNFLDGSMSRNHTYTIDLRTYAPATLYVAAQAIDAQHVGSAWSQEATIEHTYLPAEFELSRKTTPFNEAVEVHYTELPATYTHTWDWNGGTLDGNLLSFSTAGEKVITHTVTAPNGKATSYSVTLTVLPNGVSTEVTSGDLSQYLLGGGWHELNTKAFSDFNQDGNLDVLKENVVYTGATPLAFTQAAGLWNTQLNGGFLWLDWNKNGSADLLLDYSTYLPHQNNAPDMSADVVTDSRLGYFYNGKYEAGYNYYTLQADLLNIGQLTVFKNESGIGLPCYFLVPNGDSYREVQVTTDGELDPLKNALQSCSVGNYDNNIVIITDFNRDGWMDIAYVPYDSYNWVYSRMLLFENQGNGQFHQIEVPFSQTISQDDFSNAALVDLNGDGYLDIIANKDNYNDQANNAAYILWNNANASFSAPEILLSREIAYRHFVDINNDGYTDIAAHRRNKAAGNSVYGWYVWYMGPQGIVSQGFMNATESSDYNWYDVLPNRLFVDDQQYVPETYDEYGYTISYARYEPVLREVESAATNAASQAPAELRAVATTEGILIEWNDAADDHTPANKMRYNLSVKHAGQSGAGAYVISPQNGGNAQVAYLPGYAYIESNRILVSKDALTAGDYEISVQAIDQRNMMSAFSNTLTLHFDRQAIEAPTTVCTDEQAPVVYMGGESGTPVWNFNGGTVVSGTSLGTQYVQWSTPGMKTITLTMNGKTHSRMIYVDSNDANVTLPSTLVDGTEITIPLPANMDVAWNIDIDGSSHTVTPRGIDGRDKQLTISDGVLTLNTQKASVSPLTNFSNIYLTLELTNANGCTQTITQLVHIIASAKPVIKMVTTDASGHYVINWDNSIAEAFSQVVVLKETNVLDQFVEVGTANASIGSFTDRSSDASQKAERYAIRAMSDGGGMSAVSPIHQSVHMTINRGMNDMTWNLIWNQYSGADVVSYNILRGSSESTLTQIASVSAVNTSYTDVALDAQPYYAIEFVLRGQTASSSPVRRMIMANVSGRSNIVNSNAARTVTYATSLSIQSANGQYATTADKTMLLLYAEVLPSNTTYKNVVWEITSGNSLATIDRSSGLLTANTPNNGGTVTVKATTTDGTNVTATKQITIGAISDDTPVVPVYYTIRFENWNGSLLENISVLEGTMPVYSGATPTRPDDEQFTYTFTGWTPEIVAAVANATYTATYSSAPKQQGQGLDDQQVEGTQAHKVLINGTIYILRGDKVYTLTGQMVR